MARPRKEPGFTHLKSLRAAADALGCHPETLRRWHLQGRGPKFFMMGGRLVVAEQEIGR